MGFNSFAAVAGIVTVGNMKNPFSAFMQTRRSAPALPRRVRHLPASDSCGDGFPAREPWPRAPASSASLPVPAPLRVLAAIACLSVALPAQILRSRCILYFGRVSVVRFLNFVTVLAVKSRFLRVYLITTHLSAFSHSLFAAFAYLQTVYRLGNETGAKSLSTVGSAPAAVWLAFYNHGYLMYKTYKKYKTTPKYTLIKTVS